MKEYTIYKRGITHKPKPTSYYRNKADKLLQELGRATYNSCLICGGEYSCLHHYHPKSNSTALRYDMENCIPICMNHHFAHHNGNPIIHETVLRLKGNEWADRLNEKRREGNGKNYGKRWYMDMVETLSKIA